MTVAQWAEQWLEQVENLGGRRGYGIARNTSKFYRFCLQKLLSAYGNLLLQDLTRDHIFTLYVDMRKKGIHPTTCYHVHKTIRQLVQEAVRRKLIQRDIMEDVSPPRFPRNRIARALTREEACRLLDAAKRSRWWYIYRIALDTGIPRAELAGLQWKHVEIQQDPRSATIRATIRIEQQILTYANPYRSVITNILKTDNRYRTIPLSQGATECLLEWREKLRKALNVEELPPEVFVFPQTTRGGKFVPFAPTDPEVFTRAFRRHAARAGIKGARFHSLRATCATWMAAAGVPPKTAAARLGDTVQITLQYYTGVLPGSQEKAADAVDSFFSDIE